MEDENVVYINFPEDMIIYMMKNGFILLKKVLKYAKLFFILFLKLLVRFLVYSLEVTITTIKSTWDNIKGIVALLALVVPSSCMMMYFVFTAIKQFESALGLSILLIAVNAFAQSKVLKYIQRILW